MTQRVYDVELVGFPQPRRPMWPFFLLALVIGGAGGSLATMQFWEPTDVVQQAQVMSVKNAASQSHISSLRGEVRDLENELQAARLDTQRVAFERERLQTELSRTRERLNAAEQALEATTRALETADERAARQITRARAAERAARTRSAEAEARAKAFEDARNALPQAGQPLLGSIVPQAADNPAVPSDDGPDRAVGYGAVDGGGQVATVPKVARVFVARTPGIRLEDLSRYYSVSVADLMAVNPGLQIQVTQDGHFVSINSRVNIPEGG